MSNRYRWKNLALVGSCIMFIGGCSFFSADKSQHIDPPQVITDTLPISDTTSSSHSSSASRLQTVYAKDQKGFLTPISVNIPKTPSPAKTTLEYMVQDGPGAGILPQGFKAILPKGTQIKGVNLIPEKKQAVIDFSKAFTEYTATDERQLLEAITWTLTSFPSIESIQIWVEGKKLEVMPVAKTPIDEGWSRAKGINLEKSEQVFIADAMPVTLYFMNQNEQGHKYYVPITRMIPHTNEFEKAIMDQLVLGPDASLGLHSAFHPTTQVNKIKSTENQIVVDFHGDGLGPAQTVYADALQMAIWSLTENTNKASVQFMVNGKTNAVSTEPSYHQPVTRPQYINMFKL